MRLISIQHYESRFYLGLALSMLLSFRLSTCFVACVLALALYAVPVHEAQAQTPAPDSVEVYMNQPIPEPPPGIIPEGMTWNKPLKAGDMVLPRLTKPEAKTKTTTTKSTSPALTDLKAPQLAKGLKAPATAPQITGDSKSSASIMLLQGMKSALQKAGQNPELPKSEILAVDPTAQQTNNESAKSEITKDFATALAAQPASNASLGNAADSSFVSGQEPKGWLAPEAKGTGTSAASMALPTKDVAAAPSVRSVSEDGTMEIVFPPEMSANASVAGSGDTPKATELQEQPVDLENAAVGIEKKASPKDRGFLDRVTSPFTSIFGEPVDEEADKAKEDKSKSGSKQACEPKVEKWTRECSDAGYPSHFIGHIVGETRTDCAVGEAKDVWLSNTCAAPVASSPVAVQGKGSSISEGTIATSSAIQPAASVVMPDSEATIDGSCGVANGLASDGKPAADLCGQGQATPVSGDGPWRWSCKGLRGGMTVSCAAPVAPSAPVKKESAASSLQETRVEDGKCGKAIQGSVESAPTTDLCDNGTASRVNGDGPWTWACSGMNGGAAAACTANKKIDGQCGTANNTGTDTMPMRDLCLAGYASAVTGYGPWNWTCSGLHGGSAATCSAAAKVNAVCGSATMQGFRSTPSEGLCSVGTATSVAGNGPWSWSCQGELGGATVNCQADVMADGSCGPAHGNRYSKVPAEGLCAAGSPSRVTGLGPWNWNCSGTRGGSTATCTAALASKEEVSSVVKCGPAAEGLALSKPADQLCVSGKASDVSGDGPWSWTCSDDAGHSSNCSTVGAAEGVCGKAANVATKEAPNNDLCESGRPSDVRMFEKTSWKWDCEGSMGASSTSCTAPVASNGQASFSTKAEKASAVTEAQCGASAGRSYADKPSSELCEAGKASSVKGNGPWSWTCGSSKAKVVCEAEKLSDGKCGVANGSVQKSAPVSGLCSTGAATAVSGDGPWMWSCVGSGGGVSTSCSASSLAQTRVDGSCGAAGNAVMTSAPAANLCDSGVPSTVYGEGPWTWTCSGMNGGIASTCSTSKVIPKAPPPPGPAVNGVCGASNGVAANEAPEDGLCTSGTATALSGNGPWNWSCIGANSGMTVSCTAPLVPPAPIVGECGGASGVPTLTVPRSGLCSAGIASAVSGKGPWTWSCSGTNGGGAVSCVAPLAGASASAQGIPSMVTPSLESDAPSPRAAPVGLVTPQLPSGPLPALKSGELPKLKPSKKLELKKESSAEPTVSAPSSAPELPASMAGVNPPPIRDEAKPTPGVMSPVLDSDGKPVAGARLKLDPDISTISFERGSDQLDKDAVEITEKLSRILKANGNARITLVAYSDTSGEISPREARRLSLNRALAIRDFMTSKGVPSSRVDVRPMGANVPSGDMDRVDVKVN